MRRDHLPSIDCVECGHRYFLERPLFLEALDHLIGAWTLPADLPYGTSLWQAGVHNGINVGVDAVLADLKTLREEYDIW